MNNNKIFLVFLLLNLGFSWQVSAQSTRDNRAKLSGEEREKFVQSALQLRKEENYSAAIVQLDSVLIRDPEDAGILLFKGDLKLQSKLYKEAIATYKKLLPLNYESTITQINLSYALFLNHQPAKALNNAREAWKKNKTNTNAIVNYFNALLWNLRTKEASVFLNEQQNKLSRSQVMVLKARLYTTSGNYKRGLVYYDSVVKNFPDKYYTLEYSEVLLGKKEFKLAGQIMKDNKNYFSESEYKAFLKKSEVSQYQNATNEFVYFKDVADNIRIENSAGWQQGEGHKYSIGVKLGSSVITSAQNEKTNSDFGHLIIAERWNKAWSGQSDIHFQNIKPNSGESFSGLTGKQLIKFQPNDRRMISLAYSNDILNYTASILGKDIRISNFSYITHILLTGKTGIYSQGGFGKLTDKNTSTQFFGSLYHLFRTEPTFKAGLNVSAVHFKDSSIKTYFSPNRFLNSEVFADYTSALPHLSKFYVQIQAASGLQRIENKNWEPAFRFQSEIGFRITRFETSVKYQTSNVASGNGTGYKFNWLTFRLMWKW